MTGLPYGGGSGGGGTHRGTDAGQVTCELVDAVPLADHQDLFSSFRSILGYVLLKDRKWVAWRWGVGERGQALVEVILAKSVAESFCRM